MESYDASYRSVREAIRPEIEESDGPEHPRALPAPRTGRNCASTLARSAALGRWHHAARGRWRWRTPSNCLGPVDRVFSDFVQ